MKKDLVERPVFAGLRREAGSEIEVWRTCVEGSWLKLEGFSRRPPPLHKNTLIYLDSLGFTWIPGLSVARRQFLFFS